MLEHVKRSSSRRIINGKVRSSFASSRHFATYLEHSIAEAIKHNSTQSTTTRVATNAGGGTARAAQGRGRIIIGNARVGVGRSLHEHTQMQFTIERIGVLIRIGGAVVCVVCSARSGNVVACTAVRKIPIGR